MRVTEGVVFDEAGYPAVLLRSNGCVGNLDYETGNICVRIVIYKHSFIRN